MGGIWDTSITPPYSIQGNWNADTNTPNLLTVDDVGFAWIVSVPGTTQLGLINEWNKNDIAIKTLTGWAKIEPTSATWGTIVGTLSEQTDLQNALNLKATKEEALYESAGIYVEPTHTNNGNNTVTIGNGEYILYNNNDFSSFPRKYVINGDTFTISLNEINYIVADYNSGNPILKVITNVDEINESSVIPVLTCYNILGDILTIPWDNLGKGLNNKIHQRLVKTDRFTIEPNGFALGEKPTRYITVSGGRVWYGAQPTTIQESDTSLVSDELVLYYIQNGTWIRQVLSPSQYDNLHYNAPTGLVELSNGRYAVNWVFKGLSNDSTSTIIVLGTGNYNLSQAQASSIPMLPPVLRNFTFLVGRIIIQKNASSAYEIQSAFITPFTRTPVTEHNQLSNIQGGTINEFYHHSLLEFENHVYKNIINHLIGGQKIGSLTSYSEFEEDGTLKFIGDASTWVDVDFPIVIRTTGPNIPTPSTFQGNITMNSWGVNNFAVCEVQEIPHTWKEGSSMYWHVHIFTNSQDATNRYVNFEVEYTWANVNDSAPVNVIVTSGDFLIPANTPRLTNLIVPIQTFTPVGGKIAIHVKARLRRVSSTGTAPSANPFCEMLQLHIEQDTTGSRLIATK